MAKREAWRRPMCKACRKRTAVADRETCAACSPPVCAVCGCARGLNFENCRACDLAVRIVILRVRLARQWRTLAEAIKELLNGN